MEKYYKSNNCVVPATYAQLESDLADMKYQCDAFAKAFDAKAAYCYGVNGHRLYGFALNNYDTREDVPLWTKPVPKQANTSRIRSSVKMVALKGPLKELKARYDRLQPAVTKVSYDPLYESMGISWGDVLISGLSHVLFNGVIYISTRCKLTQNVIEITASEYQQAEEAAGRAAV